MALGAKPFRPLRVPERFAKPGIVVIRPGAIPRITAAKFQMESRLFNPTAVWIQPAVDTTSRG